MLNFSLSESFNISRGSSVKIFCTPPALTSVVRGRLKHYIFFSWNIYACCLLRQLLIKHVLNFSVFILVKFFRSRYWIRILLLITKANHLKRSTSILVFTQTGGANCELSCHLRFIYSYWRQFLLLSRFFTPSNTAVSVKESIELWFW